MTEHEAEKLFREMAECDKPDLWDRIESGLPEKEVQVMKKTRRERLKQFLFGGGTLRTAASVCVICIVVVGIVSQVGDSVGWFRMGASGSTSGHNMYAEEEKSEAAYDAGYGYAADDVAEAEGANNAITVENGAVMAEGNSDQTSDSDKQSSRKLIRNINLDVETLNFDTLVNELKTQTESLGGYVENSSMSGSAYYRENYSRYAELTLRIPKDKTDGLLGQIGEMANITYRSENVEDITLTYVDLESHVKALRTEEETLLKLLEQANTVEDLMSIQSELTNVRYQIESYMSQLKSYDNLVDYDTVTIYISEVSKETPTGELTVWEQMREGFAASVIGITEGFRELCIWIVAKIPYFAILFIIVFGITAIVKHRKRKKSDK